MLCCTGTHDMFMRGRTSAPCVCVRHSGLIKHTNFPATITSSFVLSCCITTYLPISARHHLIPATVIKPPPPSSYSAVFCSDLEFCEFLARDPSLSSAYNTAVLSHRRAAPGPMIFLCEDEPRHHVCVSDTRDS